MLSMYASWCSCDGVSMSFTWSFHAVFILTISLFYWCRDLHGTSMEPPWKLHQNYIRVQDDTEELSKRKHLEIAFVGIYIKPPSKLHGISMEAAWVRPLEPPREQLQNLHQNSMEPTSIPMKKYYESFAKTIHEAMSFFSLSKFEKKEH